MRVGYCGTRSTIPYAWALKYARGRALSVQLLRVPATKWPPWAGQLRAPGCRFRDLAQCLGSTSRRPWMRRTRRPRCSCSIGIWTSHRMWKWCGAMLTPSSVKAFLDDDGAGSEGGQHVCRSQAGDAADDRKPEGWIAHDVPVAGAVVFGIVTCHVKVGAGPTLGFSDSGGGLSALPTCFAETPSACLVFV